MDLRRAPGVLVSAPRISAGFDGYEPVPPLPIGQAAAGAGEVRVERRWVVVHRVHVSPGGVGLPHLDQCVTHRLAVAVDDAAADDDPFAERLAIMLPRQAGVPCEHRPAPKRGPGHLPEPLPPTPHQPPSTPPPTAT